MGENANITSAEQFMSSGPLAALLSNGLKVNALRTNALLRHEEWQLIDAAVLDIARQRLNIVQDLIAAGLVQDLGGLGVMISAYERSGDMSAANIDMAGVTPGDEDTIDFDLVQVPVPIIHKDFRINIRKLEASRKLGESLDVIQVRVAARRVTDQMETIVFNGASAINLNGASISGLTTQANINTVAGGDWGTINNIYTNVNSTIQAIEADYYFGPFNLYVAAIQYGQMRAIYTDGSGESALDRCLRGLPSLGAIKPSDTLTAGTAVMVQMTQDVIDLAIGQEITTVQWTEQGGMSLHYKVMTALAPRVKADKDGKSGICLLTGI